MNVPVRIAVSLLAPPIVGGILATVLPLVVNPQWERLSGALAALPLFVVVAFIYAGVQSVCYALILECVYLFGLKRRSLAFLALSTLLGLLSAYPIIYLTTAPIFSAEYAWIWCVGGLTGLIVGALLFWGEGKSKAAEPGATDNPGNAQ